MSISDGSTETNTHSLPKYVHEYSCIIHLNLSQTDGVGIKINYFMALDLKLWREYQLPCMVEVHIVHSITKT